MVEEKVVDGYETSYDGYNITNIIIEQEIITPPNTDCGSYNVSEVETVKPADIYAVLFIALQGVVLSFNFKRMILSK